MAGWDDNTTSSPFGYAGPTTLAPTPVHKLGRAGAGGEREESKEERKRKKKNYVPPSQQSPRVDLSPVPFGPSPFASTSRSSSSSGPSSAPGGRPPLRNTQSMPTLVEPSPSPMLSPPIASASRRRSPLIQSVLEEEEDEDMLSPPPSSESESNSFEASRSRASSVSAAESVGKRRRSAFGLGLGGVFSSVNPVKAPLSPPASPDRKGSFSSVATEGSNGDPEQTPKGRRFSIRRASAPADDSSSVRSSALSLKSMTDSTAATRRRSMWDEPGLLDSATPKKPSVSPSTPTVQLKGTMRQPSFSSRPLERPSLAARSHSHSNSVDSLNSNSNGNTLVDSSSPFASQAPVFSRHDSGGSNIVLPLRSTPSGSPAVSLRRKSSASSLKARESSRRFSFGSATSLTSLAILDPPPKVLSTRFSYSSSRSGSPLASPLISPNQSVDSFSDALTHLSVSTPRTSPEARDEGRRESMFEEVDLPKSASVDSVRNGKRELPDQAGGGWKKAIRKMKSVLGGSDGSHKKVLRA